MSEPSSAGRETRLIRLRLCAIRLLMWTEVRGPPATHIIARKADYKAEFEPHTFLSHPESIAWRPSLRLEARVMSRRGPTQPAHTVTSFVKQGIKKVTTAPPTQGRLTQQTVPCYKLKWENLKAFLEQRYPQDRYPALNFKERRVCRCCNKVAYSHSD